MDDATEPKTIETLRELLIEELSELYDAEVQLTDALPEMAEAASDRNLKLALSEHLKMSREHLRRLRYIFLLLDGSSNGKRSRGMAGLIQGEGEWMRQGAGAALRDAAVICSAQKMEHYGIAGYGTVRTFAELLGADEIAELLLKTQTEKIERDQSLNALATSINPLAVKIGSD